MRGSMSPLVSKLRGLCAAGPSDYQIGSLTYWSDDQLEAILDSTAHTRKGIRLLALPAFTDGAWRTFDYVIPMEAGADFEAPGAGSGFALRDSGGDEVPPAAYTLNLPARRITFSADQGGATFTVDARAYNVYLAAAMVWEQKAAHAAGEVSWGADNHRIDAGQEYEHCLTMARHYRRLAGLSVVEMVRVDG